MKGQLSLMIPNTVDSLIILLGTQRMYGFALRSPLIILDTLNVCYPFVRVSNVVAETLMIQKSVDILRSLLWIESMHD